MACGLPVVASPVGVNQHIVRDGVNGFLCSGDDEWVGRLQALIADEVLRRRMGDAARASAVQDWSLHRWAPEIVRLYGMALAGG